MLRHVRVSGSNLYNNNINTMSSSSSNFEISSKKLMGSYENVLEPIPNDIHSESLKSNKMYRVNLNILPVFVMELIAFGCLGALAYVLKFTNTFPVLIRGFHCDNVNAISYPKNGSTDFYESPANIEPETMFSVSLGVPTLLILIGEMGYFIFSGKRKVVRGGCIGCKLHLPIRRILRFIGVFLFGYISLTILVESLKLCTGRLRPYFMDVCKPKSLGLKSCYGQYIYPECSADSDHLRDARMSFPSYYATMSAYSAIFCTVYLDFILAIQASRLLRPSLVFLLSSLAIISATLRASLHFNHWEDVVCGLILGVIPALYLTIRTLHRFEEVKWAEVQNVNEQKDAKPLFFKYFHIPHVTYQNKSGKDYPTEEAFTTSNSHHKPSLQSTDFQKDLHQRIEVYNRRQSLNTQ